MFKSLNEEELIVSRITRVSLSNQTWLAYISHNRAMHKDFYKTNSNYVTFVSRSEYSLLGCVIIKISMIHDHR